MSPFKESSIFSIMLVTCVFYIPQSLTMTSMLPLAVLTQNPPMLKKGKKKVYGI